MPISFTCSVKYSLSRQASPYGLSYSLTAKYHRHEEQGLGTPGVDNIIQRPTQMRRWCKLAPDSTKVRMCEQHLWICGLCMA